MNEDISNGASFIMPEPFQAPDDKFTELKTRYVWKPIFGCPGRYILAEGVVSLTIGQITGYENEVFEQVLPGAVDPVAWCYFSGGGMISFKKKNGYLHTLNDAEGMARKMIKLREL